MPTEKNPYRREFPKNFFTIEYEGYKQEYYIFKIVFEKKKGMDACMFEMQLSEFILNDTYYPAYMGNGFIGHAGFPQIVVDPGPVMKNTFVIFKSRIDVELFARKFEVKFKY